MGAKLRWPADRKLALVMSALRGEAPLAELARRNGISEATIHNWRNAFLEGGREALEAGGKRRGISSREAALEAELEELKAALGEAHAELRVVKRGRSAWQTLRSSS